MKGDIGYVTTENENILKQDGEANRFDFDNLLLIFSPQKKKRNLLFYYFIFTNLIFIWCTEHTFDVSSSVSQATPFHVFIYFIILFLLFTLFYKLKLFSLIIT